MGKSAPSFCHQVAALVPDKFEKHKMVNNSTIARAKENRRDPKALEF
jgi:hypothetical protein